MMRRLLGPTGGPILFFLVAALVFGVLGWVTLTAFQVEQAQREAAARAELGSNLRVALWRLDGRMLPALGVEYSRPYYQYGPADPNLGFGFAATPLLTTNLPDWMKLHFQLDSANGWDSPQVLTADVAENIRSTWPDLPLQNVNGERASCLAEVQKKYPAPDMLTLFTSRDRTSQPDMVAVALPSTLGGGTVQPEPILTPASPTTLEPPTKQTSINPASGAALSNAQVDPRRKSFHLFGIEICSQPDLAASNNLALNNLRFDNNNNDAMKKNDLQQLVPSPRQSPGQAGAGNYRGRSPAPKDDANTGKAEAINREAETKARGIGDVQPPPVYSQGRSQGMYNGLNNSGYGQNVTQLPNDQKLAGNSMPPQPAPGLPNTVPLPPPAIATSPQPLSPTVPGLGQPLAPVAVPGQPPGTIPGVPTGPATKTQGPPVQTMPPVTNVSPMQVQGGNAYNRFDNFKDNNAKDLARSKRPAHVPCNGISGLLAEAAKCADCESDQSYKYAAEKTKGDLKKANDGQPSSQGTNSKSNDPRPSVLESIDEQARKDLAKREAGPSPPIAPPIANTIPQKDVVVPTTAPGGPAPLANYLGSMQPQWVVAPDGSEMLVLVRVAKVDNKDVCQGIILDWVKLEAVLKDEVKDLFPTAKLIPVKDGAEISPDRLMTALPIQLDPGSEPELPPAGLTTLRLGLLLAWAAAIIAFGAVGFCGWTLIDLAERRIRFVSAVTHELRTPLTSLRLYLDLLVSGMIQDEAKKQEYLNTLTVESDRLHRLIDNVLDFARLDKRRKDGDIKPVNVAELAEQLRRNWSDRLAQEGRELMVISTLPVGQEVKTDAAMIQQIIGNLIDNSRKYSRDAADRRIWVWAKPVGEKSVAIEVEDRGPGVPTNERRSIFKPFRRGEQADKTSGGAGLGLALAKSWAEVLGGKLTYRPADGGTGACFRLELPVA